MKAPSKKPRKVKRAQKPWWCKHRSKMAVQRGEYDHNASSGFVIRHAVVWCRTCGAISYEGDWTLPRGKR